MKAPYTPEELDALMSACIDFPDSHFAVGNIAGRAGISSDLNTAKELMEWTAAEHTDLLVNMGLDLHNIQYFKLGSQAKSVMEHGGIKTYLRRKRFVRNAEQVRLWLPLCISLGAATISCLAWQNPKSNAKRIDDLVSQVASLRADQVRTEAAIDAVQKKLESLPPSQPAAIAPSKD